MFRLRGTLLLILAASLALPLGGWQLVRQIEALLREGQERAQIATATTIARGVAAAGVALPRPGAGVYAAPLAVAPVLDGSAADWPASIEPVRGSGAFFTLRVGEHEGTLHLLVDVRDGSRRRADVDDPLALPGDWIEVAIRTARGTGRWRIGNGAPGSLQVLTVAPLGDSRPRGEWLETPEGYRVEFVVTTDRPAEALGLIVEDHDEAGRSRRLSLGGGELLPILRPDAAIDAVLAELVPPGARVRLVSAEGWVLGRAGDLPPPDAPRQVGLLPTLFYEWLLAPEVEDPAGLAPERSRLDAPLVWQALTGIGASAVRPAREAGSVIVTAAVPVGPGSQPGGAIVLEEQSEALLVLANRAVFGVMAASLAAVLIAVLLLVAYAGRLSLRIRRLRNATERALPTDDRLGAGLPHLETNDDLGDLARSFSRLLREIGDYNEYLKTLASKLSHELATPLAIVRSSLDNLEHESMTPPARKYAARAREGADRLAGILRAMSEAQRMEHAIQNAEGEDFDLAALVRACAEAYRDLVAPRALELDVPGSAVTIHGAPDLVAQALDKLVDNARSFTPADGWIRLRLRALEDGAELSVENSGPPLPEKMGERLFHSLVSVRERPGGETPHLGLGLFVVRLVAELHRGEARAENLADGHGVGFRMRLLGMPRRRSLAP
jgi:dedicated sortase system histidine kinase